jgi:hypothetical protein
MNRRAAAEKATESSISIGDLRRMIAATRGRGGMSRVNPKIPLELVLDIFERAIAGRPDDEVPIGTRWDSVRRRTMRTRDSLIMQNILRDCA